MISKCHATVEQGRYFAALEASEGSVYIQVDDDTFDYAGRYEDALRALEKLIIREALKNNYE